MNDKKKQEFDWNKWLEKDTIPNRNPTPPEAPETPERFDEIDYAR